VRFAAILIAVIVALDQASKAGFRTLFGDEGPDAVEILPFANIVAVWNYGISFGLFNSGQPSWYRTAIFTIVSLGIVALLVLWLASAQTRPAQTGLALIIAGALGNVIDRLIFGAVFDFMQFHTEDFYAPAFNLADAAIAVGMALLLIDGLFAGRQSIK
jgi:signal peptidase II